VKTHRTYLRSPGGFTLLELLVATTVAAIVLLVINATFFSALRLHNTTHEKIDNDLALQRALGIVRRDLAGLVLPGGILSGQLQTTEISSTGNDPVGERASPDFFTNSGKVDGWNPFSDVQMVSYFLAPATDGSNSKTLVRAVTRNLLPVQDTTTPDQQELLTGVAAVSVEFYDGTDWVADWDSTATTSMPTAVKFRLTMARPGTVADTAGPIELLVPILVMTTQDQQAAAAAGGGQE